MGRKWAWAWPTAIVFYITTVGQSRALETPSRQSLNCENVSTLLQAHRLEKIQNRLFNLKIAQDRHQVLQKSQLDQLVRELEELQKIADALYRATYSKHTDARKQYETKYLFFKRWAASFGIGEASSFRETILKPVERDLAELKEWISTLNSLKSWAEQSYTPATTIREQLLRDFCDLRRVIAHDESDETATGAALTLLGSHGHISSLTLDAFPTIPAYLNTYSHSKDLLEDQHAANLLTHLWYSNGLNLFHQEADLHFSIEELMSRYSIHSTSVLIAASLVWSSTTEHEHEDWLHALNSIYSTFGLNEFGGASILRAAMLVQGAPSDLEKVRALANQYHRALKVNLDSAAFLAICSYFLDHHFEKSFLKIAKKIYKEVKNKMDYRSHMDPAILSGSILLLNPTEPEIYDFVEELFNNLEFLEKNSDEDSLYHAIAAGDILLKTHGKLPLPHQTHNYSLLAPVKDPDHRQFLPFLSLLEFIPVEAIYKHGGRDNNYLTPE